MYEWLNNAWVIGIGGSVVSGVIVSYITRLLFKNKDNIENLQKINAANREVIYAIRPSIPEGKLPSESVFIALIDATARRYGLKPADLYTSKEISQELIKEVMDSNFISAETKEQYCSNLSHIGLNDAELQYNTDEDYRAALEKNRETHDYKERVLQMFSAAIGVATSVMTAVLVFTYSRDQIVSISSKYSIFAVLFPISAMLSGMAAVWFVSSIRRRQREQRERETMTITSPTYWSRPQDFSSWLIKKDL
ncbi:hypothetical protein IR196_04760 [Brucella anthropi]|uniref:hypothetical protein n=1 Tax=Brucella anthropi TaxID=529 RepID=UPI00188A7E6D|nr:hypothetical protein [Brucella anthropi]QPA27180.1 hypothetical protein IR196_04760 [Brucella anthropi]